VGLPPQYPLLDQITSTDHGCTALKNQMYNAAVRRVISWQEKTATIVSFLPTVTTLSQNYKTQLLFPRLFFTPIFSSTSFRGSVSLKNHDDNIFAVSQSQPSGLSQQYLQFCTDLYDKLFL